MRRLIIRDHRGHATMDLDTQEAITELEALMNKGMMAVATQPDGSATQIKQATDPLLDSASEVRAMWPLRGGG